MSGLLLDLTSCLVLFWALTQLPSCPQLSFACAQLPMIYFLNYYLYDLNHTLFNVKSCGQSWGRGGASKALLPSGIQSLRRHEAFPFSFQGCVHEGGRWMVSLSQTATPRLKELAGRILTFAHTPPPLWSGCSIT